MYKIIKLTEEQIDELVSLEELCFDEPWTKGMFAGDLKNDNTAYYAAINEKNEIIGYAGMWITVDEGQITNIAVHPNYRRLGIAAALLNTLYEVCSKNKLRSITLEVRESNSPAINLYSKAGFAVVGVRKNYYKNPAENAMLMTKSFCLEGDA